MWASLVAKGGKESTSNAEDLGSIPGLGRALGVGNDYLLQGVFHQRAIQINIPPFPRKRSRSRMFHG